MKKLLGLICVSLVMLGCNTVQGLGKDIKQGGAAIEKASGK